MEMVKRLKYLGSIINGDGDIRAKISKENALFMKQHTQLDLRLKKNVLKFWGFALYGLETYTH